MNKKPKLLQVFKRSMLVRTLNSEFKSLGFQQLPVVIAKILEVAAYSDLKQLQGSVVRDIRTSRGTCRFKLI